MEQAMLPPNPCLVAVLLIIKTRAGPRHVFHYPQRPGQDNPHVKLDYESSSEDESTTSSDDEGYSSLDDNDASEGGDDISTRPGSQEPDLDESGSVSPEKNDGHAWKKAATANGEFLELPQELPRLLCPAATFHKKKFEMSIDGLVFLGWPVFSRENGAWERLKRRKRKTSTGNASGKHGSTSEQSHEVPETLARRTSVQVDGDLGETSGHDTGIEEQLNEGGNKTSEDAAGLKAQANEHKRSKDMVQMDMKEILNMFHVVFVLDPPPLEHNLRVKEMYDNIVKKFSRALKWEQTRSGYVLKEVEIIQKLEAKSASDNYIISQSSLAKAIATLYTSVATSRIAHIDLTPPLSISLQIPIPTSTPVLPTVTSPQLPGLWLTTATSLPTDDEVHHNTSQLASHFALLLLSDLPIILADINARASPLAGPLSHYLRASSPTKSFAQISQSSGIPLRDIQFLASHLIYWRRARAVPPLHQRDTYIVSPNTDMRKLGSASLAYAKLFSTLPTLPKILSMLSSTPRPYSTLIPSKDHKAAYFEILAWLLRGGWVTQLRTFVWIRVPSHIRAAVADEIRQKRKEERKVATEAEDSEQSGRKDISENENDVGDIDTLPGYLSPLQSSAASETSSISSNRTAIPLNQSSQTFSSVHGDSPHKYMPLFIINPTRASGLESRYLSAIAAEVEHFHGKERKNAWEKCIKYFNGQHAVEKIAVREGWKRKGVAENMAVWDGMGLLMKVKHW